MTRGVTRIGHDGEFAAGKHVGHFAANRDEFGAEFAAQHQRRHSEAGQAIPQGQHRSRTGSTK